MLISERIRAIMALKKLSTTDLGKALGVSDSRIRQKLNENNWDSISELEKISNLTGYHFDWILRGEGPNLNDMQSESIANESQSKYKNEESEVIRKKLKWLEDEMQDLRKRINKIETKK